MSSALDWMLCRSFLAIVREGSLSKAARRLRLTHPTVRRHLDEMEASFGTPLFVRSPTGLVPTDRALRLIEPAENMEAAFERLHRIASDPGDTVAGTVRITASAVIGVEVLPPIMAGLKARHPALDIELDATDAVSDLLRHDADIAVRMVRPLQSTLIARRAATVPLGLFAHRLWLEATGGPASLAALLRDRQLIGYDRQPTLIEALAAQGVEAERRDFGFRSDSTLAQLAALRAGLGVGVCQVPLAARDPHLVRVLPGVAAELEIWVVSASELRTSSAVRACRELIVAGLEDYVLSPVRNHETGWGGCVREVSGSP